MNVGMIFILIATLLFFFAATGIAIALVPNATAWGLFCLALGILLSGVPIPYYRRAPPA
jgi:hypothetical protein